MGDVEVNTAYSDVSVPTAAAGVFLVRNPPGSTHSVSSTSLPYRDINRVGTSANASLNHSDPQDIESNRPLPSLGQAQDDNIRAQSRKRPNSPHPDKARLFPGVF